MSEPYTPTTDEVETAFHEFASKLETEFPGEYEEAPEFADWQEAMHGFRRWHAAEIHQAKAEGWDEAAAIDAGCHDCIALNGETNPYRADGEVAA